MLPFSARVVISPHIYGPSVSHREDFYKGEEWMLSLDKSFGYLNKDGYCYKGKCHVFPVAVGKGWSWCLLRAGPASGSITHPMPGLQGLEHFVSLLPLPRLGSLGGAGLLSPTAALSCR